MPTLAIPIEDNDREETNIQADIREALDKELSKEIPRLKTMDLLLASDYFKAGYLSAIENYKLKE